MNEIERKALALVNEVRAEHGGHPNGIIAKNTYAWDALCRAIEQHDAYKQEVSDAVESLCNTVLMSHGHREVREMLSRRFILAKPDPLVEALKQLKMSYVDAEDFRAALAARGLEIREKQG